MSPAIAHSHARLILWCLTIGLGNCLLPDEIHELVQSVEAWRDCPEATMYQEYLKYCTSIFVENLQKLGNESDICLWPDASSTAMEPYNHLTLCLGIAANETNCKEMMLFNRFMLAIHRHFYSHCDTPPEKPKDAPKKIIASFVSLTTVTTLLAAGLLAGSDYIHRAS
ncbi:receptor activity-modifying protein 1-like [Branchiostoma floridae]|uniref:Receptor activity-modifying protein 1-like n=1 Tax=Branchiostoma floridae TaxID=7739 RepID=A0A9J7N407_BRAFL|nr:receptor activity-modifying protein 1-like [Branchiostoma floridae]